MKTVMAKGKDILRGYRFSKCVGVHFGTRIKTGMALRLRYGGLTPREFVDRPRDDSLSKERQAVLIERAKKAREVRTHGEKVK